ncbi:TetR/AcrR family transcriptional regulator [Glycomyces algeriensis]|uniref:TetR family transcriptional regulator n=1 Tax=Glycomyces algeriensis TaxID=256037 RepID=A0A9W6LHY7_9ACTN|nr:TetR/AcrR family transcriptional regulator [Glycomyces algeriensis]MDR7350626.1 AcrR family transcriptional regulator [Glycomyces algeriensis]GLI43334.1 TetR family transcriptional regulator [Glycomyces algeriensis]
MEQTAIDRRQRQREATQAEIRQTARQLLVESGPEAMSVSAIARRMGLSGPAIYRYYGSHEALIGAVIADLFKEVTEAIERARDAAEPDSPGERLLAMSRGLRTWATSQTVEFRLLFAAPIPEANRRADSERQQAGEEFDQVFLREIERLWAERPFPVPDLDGLDPALRSQVLAYTQRKRTTLPPEAVQVFLTCWTRLYGLLVMEALDQLSFAYSDTEPVFEACLADISGLLGIDGRRQPGQ